MFGWPKLMHLKIVNLLEPNLNGICPISALELRRLSDRKTPTAMAALLPK